MSTMTTSFSAPGPKHSLSPEALANLADTMAAVLLAQQQIVNALRLAAIPATPDVTTPKSRKRSQHERGGAKWSAEEDEIIVGLFEEGASVADIASAQKRSWVSIIARLERLGYLPRDLRLADLESKPELKRRGSIEQSG